MKIYSVKDKEFRPYGKLLKGYDVTELCELVKTFEIPEEGTVYEPSTKVLEQLPIFEELAKREFGDMPVQMGLCCGWNRKLNCMEYHRCSEIILCAQDTILLLGKLEEIVDGKFDSACVKAFMLPADTLVAMYATTLHYCPVQVDQTHGFQAACMLAKGTNEEVSVANPKCLEDLWLVARNNWTIAHKDTEEAKQGVYVGIVGKNLDISDYL